MRIIWLLSFNLSPRSSHHRGREKRQAHKRETSGPWDMDAATKGHRVWVHLGFLGRKESVTSVTSVNSDPWVLSSREHAQKV